MTTPISLYYFNFPGRGEAIRLALVLGGIEFKDKHLTFQEFISSEFKHVPVMQINETNYDQSTSLLRYVGKLAGLLPKDPLEALKVDEVVMTAEDLFNAIGAVVSITDPGKKLELHDAVTQKKIKDVLETLEAKKSTSSSSKFFFGESITIADLLIHAIVMTLESGLFDGIPKTIVSDVAPSLKNIHIDVMENAKVKEWYSSKEELLRGETSQGV